MDAGLRTTWTRHASGAWLGHYCIGSVGRPDTLFAIVERPAGRGYQWVADYLGSGRAATRPLLAEAKSWAAEMLYDALSAGRGRNAGQA